MKEAELKSKLRPGGPKYVILGAASLAELEVIVCQAIQAGFDPTGGSLHSPTTPGKDNFFQAVVR